MNTNLKRTQNILLAIALVLTLGLPAAFAGSNPCNPCSAKNPCAASDRIDPKLVTRPTETKLAGGKHDEFVEAGKRLWNDKKLSTNGMACATCHQGNAAFAPSFAKPYPHEVAMATEKAGVKKIHLDEMVQLCMVKPMAARPLPWDSRQLAALTAYTAEVQKTFKPGAAGAANPCAAKNPCAPKNPCAAKNPCAPK